MGLPVTLPDDEESDQWNSTTCTITSAHPRLPKVAATSLARVADRGYGWRADFVGWLSHHVGRPSILLPFRMRYTVRSAQPGRALFFSSSGVRMSEKLDVKALLGLTGVLLTAMGGEFNGQVTSSALVDILGGLSLGHDEGTWISSLYIGGEVIGMIVAPWCSVTFSSRLFLIFVIALNLVTCRRERDQCVKGFSRTGEKLPCVEVVRRLLREHADGECARRARRIRNGRCRVQRRTFAGAGESQDEAHAAKAFRRGGLYGLRTDVVDHVRQARAAQCISQTVDGI